jgi:UDP:flavonoid glycosyltransferase YjiC (YdhE family)
MSSSPCRPLAGDVQPYVALGQLLRKDGHRIRIATHEIFRSFVTDSGLEFFSIGGDPHELMSYMVRSESFQVYNPSILANTSRPWLNAGGGISYEWRYRTEKEDARRGKYPDLFVPE